MSDNDQDIFLGAPGFFFMSAARISLLLLLPSRPISLVEDPVPDVEIKKSEVREPSVKRRSLSTTSLAASALRSILAREHLSITRTFVERVGADV